MKKTIPFIMASLVATGCISAKIVRNYESHPMTDGLVLTVDSIDYREELTRVYGTLTGRPHTSSRIDAATLDGLDCTDIDGVDLKRYFQWEEDGRIPVEIDFPAMRPLNRGTISLTTPRGVSSIMFSKSAKK